MSCCIVSDQILSKVCEMVFTSISYKGGHPAFLENRTLHKALRNCFKEQQVFQKLIDMNHVAYKTRYKDLDIPRSPSIIYTCPNFIIPAKYENGIAQIEPWYYEAVKLLSFYLYQCCEGDIPNYDLYIGIEILRGDLLHFIVRSHSNYIAAAWG